MHDDVYDDGIWDVVNRWQVPPRRMPAEVASGWRAGLGATALMTAVALGVRDVLEPKHDDPIIEEGRPRRVVVRRTPGRLSPRTGSAEGQPRCRAPLAHELT